MVRHCIFFIVLMSGLLPAALCGSGPKPGDVYREFHVVMGGIKDWRVTDASAPKAPVLLLPNSTLRLEIPDLNGAIRAEAQLERWGGHTGTIGKSLRLNGKEWIAVPELATTPPGKPGYCYTYQDNPTVEVPLSDLQKGVNSLEGNSTGQDTRCGNNWGQWGWYSAIVRVYYDPAKLPHPGGRITSHAAGKELTENPVVQVSVQGPSRIDRVDLLAYYDGFDEDGDGVFQDWHQAYRYAELVHHAGTAMVAPFKIRWDTAWVPDQAPGSVKLMARIRDSAGVWSVTPVVDRLTLKRVGSSVKFYKPRDVPDRYWARAGKLLSSKVAVPDSDPLAKATSAVVALRTWNGLKYDFRLNDHTGKVEGAEHNYAFALRPVPVAAVHAGENTISFQTPSKDHGLEILWPGPALLVRYGKSDPVPEPTTWLNPDYVGRIPVDLTSSVPLRPEKPVEIEMNFTEAMRQAGLSGTFDDHSIRVVDYDEKGLRDGAVSWQFDRGPQYDPHRNAVGTLTVLARVVAPGMTRRLMVYFSTTDIAAPRLMPPAGVRVTDDVDHAGQRSVRVSTSSGDYVYHKEGAGFASLFDREGNDWIGFHPGDRAAGEFRGIPNLGPYFHPGYTGKLGSRTTIEITGPIKARLRSESQDGKFACVWDFFPDYARMTLLRADQPYWFLYEGTPGGKLDMDGDFWVASDGVKRPVAESWVGNLPSPEWAYFGDAKLKRVLFLVNHQNDAINDQFRHMDSSMTVFGFGRRLKSLERFMTATPAQFTIGFIEMVEDASPFVNSAGRVAKAAIGRAEARPKL